MEMDSDGRMSILGRLSFFKWIVLGIVTLLVWTYVSNPLVVTVTGTGEVDAKPQSATIAFAVSSKKNTAEAAKKDVELRALTMQGILTSYAVSANDIARSQVTVTPSAEGNSVVYTATLTLGAKLNNYEKAEDLVSALYSNGALYVAQPVLSSEESSKLESDAYKKAIEKATDEANEIAWQNKKFVRKIVSIVKTVDVPTTSVTQGLKEKDGGTFKVSSAVSVTYKMW